MTTEVLRNMLYANSDTLHGLSHVVMDEVHFLADRMRGAVWEEVILHLSEDVRLVSLSATVSNAEEFGGWIQTVRGNTTVVVDEHRPVPLWQHVMVGKRMFDLFDYRSGDTEEERPRAPGGPTTVAAHRASTRSRPAGRLASARAAVAIGADRSIFRGPSRPDVIELLDAEGLLPAITFIFSRAGCDAAVKQCLRSSLRLTTDDERARIAEVVDRRCADLSESDLVVLGYHEWREGLLRGLAAHHAGMLPVFRHTVEELFTEGLVKAVFATETLALGINMPARTVVLERLVKFDGEQHVQLTPGEYTQLTGRAGRRGIDVEGHAVVLWTPGRGPRRGRRPGLHPNVPAAQLVRAVLQHDDQPGEPDGPDAGAQAAGAVVRAVPGGPLGGRPGARHRTWRADARRDRRRTRRSRRRRSSSTRGCARRSPQREKAQSRASRLQRRKAVNDALSALRRGDIVNIANGRRAGLAVVLEACPRRATTPGRWC